MRISGVSNQEDYRLCYKLNSTTKKLETGSYNYSAFMEQLRQQEKAALQSPPQVGNKELSERELQELSERYDPENMSQMEYDTFIRELADKGVLGRDEMYDIGMSRRVIKPGHFTAGYVTGSLSGQNVFIHTLDGANGNAVKFAKIMCQWQGNSDEANLRANAFSKVFDILMGMKTQRE